MSYTHTFSLRPSWNPSALAFSAAQTENSLTARTLEKKNPANAKKTASAIILGNRGYELFFIVFRFPDYCPIGTDGVDVGFGCEFTHNQKHADTTSET